MPSSDAARPGESTDNLMLSGSNSPNGIAVKLYKDDSPIMLGPETTDTSSPYSISLFDVAPDTTLEQEVRFTAKVFRTASDVTAGAIEAAALVTLNYD